MSSMFNWNWFLRITTARTLYLIGAGASSPEIGLGDSLSNEVRKRFWTNGILPATPQSTTPLKSAILRPNTTCRQQGSLIGQKELDAHTPPEFIEVLLAQLLTRKGNIPPIQYRVFDLFHPSVIFNYNVDNLADGIHQKHVQVYPHGKLNPAISHSSVLVEALDLMAIPPSVAKYFDYWRPIPEHLMITSTRPFLKLKEIFPTVDCVCIIGYSFGAWSGGIDDSESFEMLVDLLCWRPKPVLIVDPAPQHLANSIESLIKVKNVHRLCCRWNILAEFIASGLLRRMFLTTGGSTEQITNAYLYFDEIVARSREMGATLTSPDVSALESGII